MVTYALRLSRSMKPIGFSIPSIMILCLHKQAAGAVFAELAKFFLLLDAEGFGNHGLKHHLKIRTRPQLLFLSDFNFDS